ncbi:hypothetical protein, partial [Brucella sp. 83/13]|uniref:hypothetical protein n=1 Tax=Brucella sp. 83/13 TaxID=520449 RepID=UPI001AEC0DE1
SMISTPTRPNQRPRQGHLRQLDRYTRDTLEASVLNGLQQASYGARTVQRFLRGICVGSKQGRIAARVSIEAAETEEKRSTANLKGFSIFTSKRR